LGGGCLSLLLMVTTVQGAPLTLPAPEATFYEKSSSLAQEINTLTGLAISPSVTVAILGAYSYWKTPSGQRQQLPWLAQPLVWGSLWVLLLIVLSKDFLFGLVPSMGLRQLINGLEAALRAPASLLAVLCYLPVFWGALQEVVTPQMVEMMPAISAPAQFTAGYSFDLGQMMLWFIGGLILLGSLITCALYGLVSLGLSLLNAVLPFGFMVWLVKLARLGALALLLVFTMISPFLGLALLLGGSWLLLKFTNHAWKWGRDLGNKLRARFFPVIPELVIVQ
jgi:hypothetical protein